MLDVEHEAHFISLRFQDAGAADSDCVAKAQEWMWGWASMSKLQLTTLGWAENPMKSIHGLFEVFTGILT